MSDIDTSGIDSLNQELDQEIKNLNQEIEQETKPKKRRGNPHPGIYKGGPGLPGAGRPKGSLNKKTLLKEAIMEKVENNLLKEWETVVKQTIQLAKAGDSTCLKILWDRMIPAKRAIEEGGDPNRKRPEIVINISTLEPKVEASVKDITEKQIVTIDSKG